MLCLRISVAITLVLLLLAITTKVALSKEKKKEKVKELGDVVFEFLDKNRDKVITIPEMNHELLILGETANQGGGGDADTEELRLIIQRVRKAAPYIFNLLDQNEDRRLDKDETKYITKFEESLNHNGNARILLREWFEVLDDDVDDRLDADEILEGTKSSFLLGEIASVLHQFFPLRDTPFELKIHIKRAMRSMWGEELNKESVAEAMKWLDDDGDGYIQWTEMADAYNSFGKKFVGMADEIKKAGPMMGMFGKDEKGEKAKKDATDAFFKQTTKGYSDIGTTEF